MEPMTGKRESAGTPSPLAVEGWVEKTAISGAKLWQTEGMQNSLVDAAAVLTERCDQATARCSTECSSARLWQERPWVSRDEKQLNIGRETGETEKDCEVGHREAVLHFLSGIHRRIQSCLITLENLSSNTRSPHHLFTSLAQTFQLWIRPALAHASPWMAQPLGSRCTACSASVIKLP